MELTIYGSNLSKNSGKLGFPTKISEFFRENLSVTFNFGPDFFSKCPQQKKACNYTINRERFLLDAFPRPAFSADFDFVAVGSIPLQLKPLEWRHLSSSGQLRLP